MNQEKVLVRVDQSVPASYRRRVKKLGGVWNGKLNGWEIDRMQVRHLDLEHRILTL
ncbi:hypothetical protein WDW89_12060 [Deltaproteobacteria bacterium TL4]